MLTPRNAENLRTLIMRCQAPSSGVISVYLDLDQSRPVNLARHYETVLRDQLNQARLGLQSEQEKRLFESAARLVQAFVRGHEPNSRGLAVIHEPESGYTWTQAIDVAVPNMVRWDRCPYIQPLAELLDEFERYLVVVVDRTKAVIYAVAMGAIEMREQITSSAEVRHIKTTGSDHIGSASHFQRRADHHILHHLKRVAGSLERMCRRVEFHRLIVAGAPETTAALKRLLADAVSRRVIGTLQLPIAASEREVLEATATLVQKEERDSELRLVQSLLTASGKNSGAVTGLNHTLKSLQNHAIWKLVYTKGLQMPGAECPQCGALYPKGRVSCSSCRVRLRQASDLMERIVEQTIRAGGRVDAVNGEAGRILDTAGGVGAFTAGGK